MSELSVSLHTARVWRSSYLKEVQITNSGSEPVSNPTVIISTSADIKKIWDGGYTDLGGGQYLLTFEGVTLQPGESATLSYKASGVDDAQVVEIPDPNPDPTTITVASDITATELQNIIDTAAAGTTIQMEAGTYVFDQTITISGDGISLIGAGPDQTIIDASALTQEAFAIGDGTMSGSFTLATDAPEGTTTIELAGSHSFEAGDYIYLERESTEAFYDEIGDETWRNTDVPLRTSIVQVIAVDGNTLTLSRGVHFDFTTGETTVREISMAEDLTIGGFSIDYGLGTADPSLFENTLPEFHRDAVIQVEGTENLTIYDITAHDVPSLGINFALSTNVSADNIEITGAHNKGDGGNGYAIQIRAVYDSSFTNLSDLDMRHSVVFASWRSAVDNFVHVSSTDRDINFHGGRDHGNTVLVDQSLRDANSDIISPTLFVNSDGTSYGAPTDPNANTAHFGYVIGSRLADNVQGYDAGAWLDGAGGHDTLTGGDGNDVLIGGTGDDTLIGGQGEDIAVFTGSYYLYDVTLTAGGVQVNGVDTDTATQVEWLLFDDVALRTSDLTLHARSTLDGIFTGVSTYDPTTGTYVPSAGPTLDTSDPAETVIYGTADKDIFDIDTPNTIVWGLGNWDVVRASVDFILMDDVEKLELIGDSDLNGTGGNNDNIITGTIGSNIIDGKGGDDRIWARSGDDVVSGATGNDELYGGGGNDTITGGEGTDTLTGDSGSDIFIFEAVTETLIGFGDWIMDFVSGVDVIDLSGIDADATIEGDQAFTIGGTGTGSLTLEGNKIQSDVDGDGVADLEINVELASLETDDFIL